MTEKDQIKEVMAQCYLSTKVFAQVLLHERFFRPFSSLTDQIFVAIDDPTIQLIVIKAPRGWGKTSIVNFALPAKKILFQEEKFIVPISSTATQAVLQSENLKRELLTNKDIIKIFGSVKPLPGSPIADFSKEAWATSSGTLVMPRGAGQQVRGILFGNNRPGLIVVDDLEDPESVMSEDQRKKLKRWFFDDVLNSVDRGSKNWKIVFIGTLLHEDSLLQAILDDDSWHRIEIDLCNDNLESNWPDFMSTEDVKSLYNKYKRQGLLDSFYREYRGVAKAHETANFKQEYFRDYDEQSPEFRELVNKPFGLENVVIIDPAKTTNWQSADSAIVGVGVDLAGPRIFVRDIIADKLHPDEIYQQAFDMADRIGARTIGYEVTSLNEFITYPITTAMIRRGRFYNLVELKARAQKPERIAMLTPFYRMRCVYHNPAVCPILESQLLAYPNSKRWDVMDAFAYIIEMLEIGDRYFEPDESEFDEVEKDEYAEVEMHNEPPLEGWRIAP